MTGNKYKFKVRIEVKSRQNCCMYVAVNFLSQVIFIIFCKFSILYHTQKQLTKEIKISYNIYIKVWLNIDVVV